MGKGTIVRHLGEGQYRVRLNRSTARIDVALARIATDLSVLQGRIDDAWQELQDAETRLSAAIHDINAAIEAISDHIQELADAVREARELVDQRTDELRTAEESLDFLEQAKMDDPDAVTEEQIRIATEQRDAKQALLDAANDQLTTATDAWNARDVDVKEQDAKIVEAAKLREKLGAARLAYNGLLLEKSSLEKHKAWLESKRKADFELDAWCADLTDDLEGEVGTIEIPGERTSDTQPVIIRPGYEERATYQPRDPHQSLIDAKQAAFTESIQAQDRLDAAQSALDVEASKLRELKGRLTNLLSQPERDQAEIVFLQGQIEASDALIPILEVRKATMDEALSAAQAAFDAASQSLTAARAADSNPRLADGILQSIPAAPGPFSSFFNQTLLPAWQKWRPMYRVGTITALSDGYAAVLLDEALSSQQSTKVNRTKALTRIPIEYMECNADAFEVGDRVVVEFRKQDPERPVVIGFESHPKACTKSGFLIDIRARIRGGPNYSPKRFGQQAFTPTPDQPIPPPSPYAPYGNWPADSESPVEYVNLKKSGDNWTAKFRVTQTPAVAFGNRRYHAWDGTKYLGCLSWRQKPAFGGEWYSRPGTWAGPIIKQGQTIPPPESDYMIEKQEFSTGFAHGDIAHRGKIVLKAQNLTSGLSGISGMRVVAACIVRVPLPIPPGAPPEVKPDTELRLRVITWHWAAKRTAYGDVDPKATLAGARMKPTKWRTYTEFVPPGSQLFCCWEGKYETIDEPTRRAGMVKVAQFSGVDPIWTPNPNDSQAFDLAYIDSSEGVRPETPLGQFSRSGTKATAIYIGGTWWTHNVLNVQIYQDWAWGAGAIVRFEWPVGGIPSATFETTQGTQKSGYTLQVAEVYDEEHEWFNTISNTWAQNGYTISTSRTAVAVDYDGEEELLLWYRYAGSTTSERVQTETDNGAVGSYTEARHAEHSIVSSNGTIAITVSDEGSTQADFHNGTDSGRSSVILIHSVDLVTGEIYWTQWRGGSDQSLVQFQGVRIFSSRAVMVRHNADILLHDETYELWGYGRVNAWWDNYHWGGPYYAPSVVHATEAPWRFDVTRGHIEAYHYGKGPSVAYARDQHGNFVGAIAYNEWAPLVNAPGYHTAGGFVPNTTHRAAFVSNGESFTELAKADELTGLEWAVRAIWVQ